MPRQRTSRTEREIEKVVSTLNGVEGSLLETGLMELFKQSEEAVKLWKDMLDELRTHTTDLYRVIQSIEDDEARLRVLGQVLLHASPEARYAWIKLFKVEHEPDFDTSAYFDTPIHRMVSMGQLLVTTWPSMSTMPSEIPTRKRLS
jgi:hypothetical protein